MLGFWGVVLPVIALGCGKSSAPPIAKSETLEVSIANPLQQSVTKSDEYLATIDAAETVQLKARVTGYLTEIRFTAGRDVKKGDVLFVIDKRTFEVDLKKAQADVKSAQAQLVYANKEVARLEKGLRNQSVSREDYDKAVANISVAEAQVEVANSSIDRAKLNLDFCEVKSPIDGKVSREAVTIGNLIQADATVMTTIVSQEPVYAYFDIDQRTVQDYLEATKGKRKKIEQGEVYPIRLALDNDVGFPHEGAINFAETRLNPQTGALQLRGVFVPRNLKSELLPGFTARVRVPGPDAFIAIVVPDRCINTDQDRKFVYLVNSENKVEYRPVKLGILTSVYSYEVRVVTEGLSPTDRVIINGMQNVRQGMPVVPKLVNLLTEVPMDSSGSAKKE
jgi:RND family efflux transporter MFP subunit